MYLDGNCQLYLAQNLGAYQKHLYRLPRQLFPCLESLSQKGVCSGLGLQLCVAQMTEGLGTLPHWPSLPSLNISGDFCCCCCSSQSGAHTALLALNSLDREDDLEHLILLPSTLECWDYRHVYHHRGF